jgi:hypothetical protein
VVIVILIPRLWGEAISVGTISSARLACLPHKDQFGGEAKIAAAGKTGLATADWQLGDERPYG